MDYSLEQLGPERFQEVCQALLVRELPGVQCFPVGMPDGGRDALQRRLQSEPESFIVFQVKFSRNPQGETDPHKWLAGVIAEEAPKVAKLIPKGARSYYLLTNVRGTAHADTGAIDQVSSILKEHLTIPGTCWWRDDINRRLDSGYDIKWTYPELLSGPDLLRALVHSALTEERERRTSTIAAFVREQYEREKEIRFKQVELQNDLFALFVDTPVAFRRAAGDHRIDERRQEHVFRHIVRSRRNGRSNAGEDGQFDEPANPGAAEILLDRRFQDVFRIIVLEGAPGQGKSTVTQFISQIYRARLLHERDPLPSCPGVRLPIRIDLRDYAVWLDKRNPFANEEDRAEPASWNKSLESFVSALIQNLAGGAQFTVADLHAVARKSALSVVLDGLDEVADIVKRTSVISELTSGLKRLSEVALSLQGIITSRPAAFSKTLGFEGAFPHFTLLALPPDTIREYSSRWVAAKRLPPREAADTQRILKTKLELPHFRELATNPMQLAILLSLINARGASLPDKRTALYDAYVELFFSREAEKSEVVRRHRDLLLDVHRHLAWVLHGEAEIGKHRGSVSAERLSNMLQDYLVLEGQDPALGAVLRRGMIERIVFLVSRVEGTFEFEVQPIREYFAARHLYETAPYSPPGSETSGTKPDRFLAVASNPYWLNVSRFLAGCFSKGELRALVDCLLDLGERSDLRYTGEPCRLTAMLLSDWVFAQSARATSAAVQFLADSLDEFRVVSARRRAAHYHPGAEIELPDECGRKEFVERCFRVLASDPPIDYAFELCDLIKANSTQDETVGRWVDGLGARPPGRRDRWFLAGMYLGALSHVPDEVLAAAGALTGNEFNWLLHAGRGGFIEAAEQRVARYLDAVLDGGVPCWSTGKLGTTLDGLAAALNWEDYELAFQHSDRTPLKEIIAHFGSRSDRVRPASQQVNVHFLGPAAQLVSVVEAQLDRDAREWAQSLSPWQEVIRHGQGLFGDRWAFYRIANLCGGIRVADTGGDDEDICYFAASARVKGRAPSWWQAQFSAARSAMRSRFLALLVLTWGTPSALDKVAAVVSGILDEMPREEWELFARETENAIRERWVRRSALGVLRKATSPRLASLLLWRGPRPAVLSASSLARYRGNDPYVLEACARAAINEALGNSKMWSTALRLCAKAYGSMTGTLWPRVAEASPVDLGRKLDVDVARRIIAKARQYPRVLVHAAEQACRMAAARAAEPVLRVAAEQRWFDEGDGERISL